MKDLLFLTEPVRTAALSMGDRLSEIRLRRGKPVLLRGTDNSARFCAVIQEQEFQNFVSALLDYSLYARKTELDRGFFTLNDGSRAGVCGDFSGDGISNVSEISSVCIRIARERKGSADPLMERIRSCRGALLVSPPGLGKTTMLRDIARQLSEEGKQVCLIDERGELAAGRSGIPTLDVGPCTDVISFVERSRGMEMAIRSCAPDVLITDELGSRKDAAAVSDALRRGVKVIASAHGDSLEEMGRGLPELFRTGRMNLKIRLGGAVGRIAEIVGG